MKITQCLKCGGKVRAETIGWKCEKCKGFINLKGEFFEHIERPFLPKQTNYDRIRNMSVEELAEFMQKCGWDFPPYCDYQKATRGICNQNCKECAKQWLESEVTE